MPLSLLLAALAAADPPDLRAFCIDFNWGPGLPSGFAAPGLWANASPEEHVAWYEALGCNVIQTFAVSCNGRSWYKDGVVPAQPGLARDFLPEVVKLGHARGMKVMGYFCAGANALWAEEHPDLSYGAPGAPHIPFTTEYLDYLAASIEDALRKTGMDGFMIDWMWNPGDWNLEPLRWLPCERATWTELLGGSFPGPEAVTKEQDLEFRRRAIDRCWERIRSAAKEVKPDCILWLSCSNVAAPTVVDSRLFREVDWSMNEATDPAALAAVARMKGPHTRLIQCVVGWGDAHDARRIVTSPAAHGLGIYGFAKPGESSLPLPVAEYRARSIASFAGNDRNIAVLARLYTGLDLDILVVAGAEFPLESVETGTWRDYRTFPVGTIAIGRPGRQVVAVVPVPAGSWHAISLKSIRLEPVR
ncbi:MAG: hypothetical protein AB1726_00770 [Planctomycetota bacterium]